MRGAGDSDAAQLPGCCARRPHVCGMARCADCLDRCRGAAPCGITTGAQGASASLAGMVTLHRHGHLE
jgi:hypothetical protein